jgi:oligopeptide/dipeptide ABC transporter ATP-binding protein
VPVTEILSVSELRTDYYTSTGTLPAVRGISFGVSPGEVLGVVGESGCGKSATALSLLRLIAEPQGRISGSIKLGDRDLMSLNEKEMRQVRGRDIAMIFQDPMSSLNPSLTIGTQLTETLRFHLGLSRAQARERAAGCLGLVGLSDPEAQLRRYPHEFSGGMRQRVMIAMAISCQPRALIADEATTALDVTIQAQVLELIRDLKEQLGMAVIMITHDLGLVAGMADRILVMYAGQIIESGPVDEIFGHPAHPYTRGLLDCIPQLDSARSLPLRPIRGAPPRPTELPGGCPFHPRCAEAMDVCRESMPAEHSVTPGHVTACWLAS